MSHPQVSRRQFVAAGAAGAAALAVGCTPATARAAAGPLAGKIKLALKYEMIGLGDTAAEKLKLVKDIGYASAEPTVRSVDAVGVDAMKAASEEAGLPIHGVVNGSSVNLSHAVEVAKAVGASSVLVVAGRVNEDVAYDENFETTRKQIAAAIPDADRHGIDLLIENVWNNFLLSPLEMRDYVDGFSSERVGVYFDCGNVVRFGYPDQWIRILGKRVRKLDLKEYSRKRQNDEGLWKGFDSRIGDDDGSVGWDRVVAALDGIGYSGWATAEVGGGDRERLADVLARMTRVLQLGQSPRE